MDAEVLPLEHNGQGTFYRGHEKLFESIHVDHVLHDGDKVTLGGVTLTAHLTAGHTPGCTTWTMQAREGSAAYDVVFMCQLSLMDDQPLVHNGTYSPVAREYERTFAVLDRMPCDVFLGEHGYMFDLKDKLARDAAHPAMNPFVDPAGCKRFIEQSQHEFATEIERQRRLPPTAKQH